MNKENKHLIKDCEVRNLQEVELKIKIKISNKKK